MDRRSFLAGAFATAVLPRSGLGAAPGLRALAASRGLDIGSAVGETPSTRLLTILDEHCTLITPEWQLKPKYLRFRAGDAYNFRPADEIAALAGVNGQALHGHSLYWHRQPIPWASAGDLDTVKRLYGAYIRDVLARYPQIVSWDVFNEILDERSGLETNAPLDRFGLDFVEFCFRTAHEAAPHAKLVLNDHSLECAGSWCGLKQRNAVGVIRELLKRGTPIHAIGLQSHLSSSWIPWGRRTANFIRIMGDLGLEVYISELDVNDSQLALDEGRRDRQVAGYYRDFLGPVLDQKALKRVVFWGISDSAHWMLRTSGGGERRKVGRPRPALFDENDDPKPAFEAVRLALEQAPSR